MRIAAPLAVLLAAVVFVDSAGRAEPAAYTAAPGERTPLTVVERPPEDELVLEVRLRRVILSDALLGYIHRGGILLPLGEIVRSLDFAILTDPAAGQAEGWFLSENRRFFLDLARGEVVVEGRTEEVPAGLAEVHFDDIYVDTTLISRWFPVDLEFDLARLSIEVTSREPLPIEQRLERERLQARLRRGAREQPQYPRQDLPYRLLDWPFVDTSLTVDYRNGTDGGPQARYTSLVSGDVLFMDAGMFLTGNDDEKLSDVRLTLRRKDPDGALLGPVGLTEFSLGDVFTPQLPLVAGQREGRGVAASSFLLSRPSEFDRTTLRGELPLGWEVELYRNEVLLDFQLSSADGRYEFVDVPLLFGNNVLRLVFYGPQGQRREEVQRFFVGPGLIRPGEQHFRVAANQEGRDFISVADDDALADERGVDNRYFAEYERGLTRNLSVAASLASFPFEEARHTYTSLGLRASLLGALMRLDGVTDSRSGRAIQGSVQTSVLDLNLRAEHGQFFDFVSERVSGGSDPLESLTDVRVDGTIPAWLIVPRIPLSFSGTLERRQSGRYTINARNRTSAFFWGITASSNSNFRLSGGGGTETITSSDGSLLLNSRLGRMRLRGQVSYTIDPSAEFTTVALTSDYDIDRDLGLRGTVSRQLTGIRTTTYSAGVLQSFESFALGLNASYIDDGSFFTTLSISFGLGREPRTGRFAMRRRGMATGGAASARAFLDRNLNDRFDEGDEPLQGVRFVRGRDAETDENGVAFITGLSSYRPTPLALDVKTLEDPYWLSTREGYEVVPRPGKTILLEFPVVPTGEIDGTVFLRRGDVQREVSNVRLELVDSKGEVVHEVKSAFDGFFLFELVRPGRYALRVSPEQGERLNLVLPPAREIVITGEGEIVSGIDIVLERAGEKERYRRDSAPPAGEQATTDRPVGALVPQRTVPEPTAGEAVTSSPPVTRPATITATPGTPTTYEVQLAAHRDRRRAEAAWERLRDRHADLLGPYDAAVRRVDLGPGSGVWFRLRLVSIESKHVAASLCARLKARDVDCFVAMTTATATPGAPTTYEVQLAAYRDRRRVEAAWERLRDRHADLLGPYDAAVRRVDLGPGRGVWFRLRLVSIESKDVAASLCARLKARDVDCYVARP